MPIITNHLFCDRNIHYIIIIQKYMYSVNIVYSSLYIRIIKNNYEFYYGTL